MSSGRMETDMATGQSRCPIHTDSIDAVNRSTGRAMDDDALSVRVTKLLGTDDWLILHSGHLMVTAEDLDTLELAAPDRQVEL